MAADRLLLEEEDGAFHDDTLKQALHWVKEAAARVVSSSMRKAVSEADPGLITPRKM